MHGTVPASLPGLGGLVPDARARQPPITSGM
jgi:hypothetical protein